MRMRRTAGRSRWRALPLALEALEDRCLPSHIGGDFGLPVGPTLLPSNPHQDAAPAWTALEVRTAPLQVTHGTESSAVGHLRSEDARSVDVSQFSDSRTDVGTIEHSSGPQGSEPVSLVVMLAPKTTGGKSDSSLSVDQPVQYATNETIYRQSPTTTLMRPAVWERAVQEPEAMGGVSPTVAPLAIETRAAAAPSITDGTVDGLPQPLTTPYAGPVAIAVFMPAAPTAAEAFDGPGGARPMLATGTPISGVLGGAAGARLNVATTISALPDLRADFGQEVESIAKPVVIPFVMLTPMIPGPSEGYVDFSTGPSPLADAARHTDAPHTPSLGVPSVESMRSDVTTRPVDVAVADTVARTQAVVLHTDTGPLHALAVDAYMAGLLAANPAAAPRPGTDFGAPAVHAGEAHGLNRGDALTFKGQLLVPNDGGNVAAPVPIQQETPRDADTAPSHFAPLGAGLLSDVFRIDRALAKPGIQRLLRAATDDHGDMTAPVPRTQLQDWLLASLVTGAVAIELVRRQWRDLAADAGDEAEEEAAWLWPSTLRDLAAGRQP